MAIIGTSEESSFSVYLFLHAEETADRIIIEMLKPKYQKLKQGFIPALIKTTHEEILRSYAMYHAEKRSAGADLIPNIMEELRDRIIETGKRPTLGVVNKDGSIQEATVRYKSTEYEAMINIVYRMAHDGYIRQSLEDHLTTRSNKMTEIMEGFRREIDQQSYDNWKQAKKPVKRYAKSEEVQYSRPEKTRKLRIKKMKRPTR